MLFLLPVFLYCLLLAPFIYLIPANDSNLEFILANRWFLNNNRFELLSLHPPVKYILFSLFFKLFGFQNIGYIGIFFGIIGIVALYFIAKKLFDEKVAILSALLLATSGLYISVGLFSIHDFLITVFILVAFACYLNARFTLYAIFASLAVLTKETALFFAISIVLAELLTERKTKFYSFFPLITFAWYLEYLYFSGNHIWNAWNFSTTANHGSIYTMLYNLVTLQFLNKYAYENWLHLFIFNFNWTYWIFALISLFFIKTVKMKKTLLPICLFFLSYILMTLSFQTYTITRYILPLLPFLYLFAAFGISKIRFSHTFAILLIIISFVSLYQSVDPLSNLIWPKIKILHENFYIKGSDGADGLTYNIQYLDLLQERTNLLKNGMCIMPPLIAYERQTLQLLHINSCL